MKKLSLLAGASLSLVLVACPQPSTPDSALTSLSSTVVEVDRAKSDKTLVTTAWTGGAGTVITMAGSSTTTSTSLAASGAFTLNLPATMPDSDLVMPSYGNAGQGCTSQPTVSDPAARLAFLFLGAGSSTKSTALIMPITVSASSATTGTLKVGDLFYADRVVTISGTTSCSDIDDTDRSGTVNFNLTLKKGWNMVTATVNTTASTVDVTYTSGSFPTNNWVYDSAGLASLSVTKSSLGLKQAAHAFDLLR